MLELITEFPIAIPDRNTKKTLLTDKRRSVTEVCGCWRDYGRREKHCIERTQFARKLELLGDRHFTERLQRRANRLEFQHLVDVVRVSHLLAKYLLDEAIYKVINI